jgi:hypothetical protein
MKVIFQAKILRRLAEENCQVFLHIGLKRLVREIQLREKTGHKLSTGFRKFDAMVLMIRLVITNKVDGQTLLGQLNQESSITVVVLSSFHGTTITVCFQIFSHPAHTTASSTFFHNLR